MCHPPDVNGAGFRREPSRSRRGGFSPTTLLTIAVLGCGLAAEQPAEPPSPVTSGDKAAGEPSIPKETNEVAGAHLVPPAADVSPNEDREGGENLPASVRDPNGPSLDELLLFFPSRYPEGNWKPVGLDFENVRFESEDGPRLHGWYCPCDTPRAVLLYLHGNGGNLSFDAPLMAYLQRDLQVSALIFDYRGYGRSAGVPSVAGVLQDARAARTLLARRAGITESDVVLMGRSLGGTVAVQLAAEAEPRGLILESTFSSLRDVAEHHHPQLAWLVPADKLNSTEQIARYRGPLLQSHGDRDRTIPYAMGLKLFDAANEPKRFVRIPGGGHNSRPPANYYRELNRFLSDLPAGRRAGR